MLRWIVAVAICLTQQERAPQAGRASEQPTSNARPLTGKKELRNWLENMVWYHRFSTEEISRATGWTHDKIDAATRRLNIHPESKPVRAAGAPLLVLPYPGGRHPRIGFLEGAIRPQRETKFSVFAPWDDAHYVVVDIPEAIWWDHPDRELLYLAHTHIPTTWTKRGIALSPAEWSTDSDGSLCVSRTLPNGVSFGAVVNPTSQAVFMELWLTNGTDQMLTGLDVQACVMFRGIPPLATQTNSNKVFSKPYAACGDATGERWAITGWDNCTRAWGNEQCPCMHSDPRLPDCRPGATVRVRGFLSFYEGRSIKAEMDRFERLPWRSLPWRDEMPREADARDD